MKNRLAIMIVCLIGLACITGPALASTDLTVSVNPETVQIGAGYNGGQVSLTGQVPADTDVLIRVKGKSEHYKLKQKGRAMGILWMNLGSVEISNVPNLFLLFLPPDQDQAGQNGATDWQASDLGLKGVQKASEVVAEGEDTSALFDEFVKLKQQSGLYATTHDAIQYGPDEGGLKSFKATLTLPAALPQGKFDIEVAAVKNGRIETSVARPIEAREVGLPAWIAKMAFHHGTLYGVMAVVAAVLAGLLTGIMFKGEKGAH